MTKAVDPERVLAQWTERDLAEAARVGKLNPSWEIDSVVQAIADVVRSGRYPVVVGGEGVGKTAAIEATVRRAQTEPGFERISGRRVLEISIRSRLSSLDKPDKLRPEMQALVTALEQVGDRVVPFLRDVHFAYLCDLEPQIELLAQRFPGAILCEADGPTFDAMMEWRPELERLFAKVPVHEPDLEKTEKMALAWAEHARTRGFRMEPSAVVLGLQLGHRFLGRLRQPRKTFALLNLVQGLVGKNRAATDADIIEAFVETYGMPRLLVDPRVPFDPVATTKAFRGKVLEQPEAVDAVVRMISIIKSGLSDARRPFGAFLFVGPTGVGKTHIAQLLAEHLFGSRDRLVRINMADFPNPEDALVLFGNPDAGGLRAKRGLLATRLLGHPFAVLLLDEFEKAHPKVHDRFLQLVDEGRFVNGAGEVVSCRSSVVVATSNAGAEVFRTTGIGFAGELDAAELDRELDRQLARQFRHEFLNRFDEVVHFRPLSRNGIREIALREIEGLRERPGIRSRDLTIEVDESVLDWLAAHGYHPHFGARFLRRTMERSVTNALAELLVRGVPEGKPAIELSVRGGRITAAFARPEAEHDEAARVTLPEGTRDRARKLDRDALLDEASDVVNGASAALAAVEEKRGRAEQLLSRMNETAFWNDRARAQAVLDEYRELDVAVRVGSRILSPVVRLRDLLSASGAPVPTDRLARAVEEAARGLRDWGRRHAEDGPGAVWLLLRSVDPLASGDEAEFLEQITEMELAWCRKLHLAAEVVAFSMVDDQVARVVLEVEGPGALAYLEMEQGLHRSYGHDRGTRRVRADVLPKRAGATAAAFHAQPIRGKKPQGAGLEATHVVRFEHESSGQIIEVLGTEGRTLEAFVADLSASQALGTEAPTVAREYGRDGVGARDPRTGETLVRAKDALSGKLDRLLEAWLRAKAGSVTTATTAG